MDFSLTQAQHDIGELAGRILGDWENNGEDRHTDVFDSTLWTTMSRAGVLDAALPESVGGGGFGLLEQCSVLIEVGKTVAPVPYLTSIVAGASAIARFGSGLQAERWVIPATRGQRTLTIALADAGSDPGFTAQQTGSGWRLDGAAPAVPCGAYADGFLCEVSTPQGDVLVVLDREHEGLTVTEQHVVDGADAALLELDEVTVDDDAVLGEPGNGAPGWVRARTTVGLCALQLGIVSRALDMTSQYAREREQFDSPIGAFQAVRQRLADAYLDVEAVRLTLWQAAWMLTADREAPQETTQEIATAKFWAAEAGHRVAHTAVHIHGGVGIDTDYPLHRYFTAAKRTEFALGGATAHLRTLGASLAEEPS